MADELVNLRAFRKYNHITQKQVADFLDLSVGFISQVENGSSKLSDLKLQQLVQEGEWDTCELVPHYHRFLTAWEEYNRSIGKTKLWPNDDINPFGIEQWIVDALEHGELGIDDRIADAILTVIPTMSRQWLLTGEGPMRLPEDKDADRMERIEKRFEELLQEVRSIKELLKASQQ